MGKYILVDKLPSGVLHVRLNRPKALNAMNEEFWVEYGKVFEDAESDSDVRAIVLSAEGRAFCAGLDLKSAGDSIELDEEVSRRGIKLTKHIHHFQSCIQKPWAINKPVIAAAHGIAVGLAIDIMAGVDIRYASKDTQFSIKEVTIGLAADIGSLQQLPKILGSSGWLKEMAYTGRSFSAQEAKDNGFVDRVFETKEEAVAGAIKLAEEIAQNSPVAVHGTKNALRYAIDHPVADSLRQIAEYNAHGVGADMMESVVAFINKQKPTYAKL